MLQDTYPKSPYRSFKISDLANRLARLQRVCQAMDIPVLIIVDGWESSGRGTVINDLCRELDPKHFNVSVFDRDRKDFPYMGRFWRRIPAYGDVRVFDRSYYFDLINNLDMDGDVLERKLNAIRAYEEALYADRAIVLKFFIDIPKEDQKDRIEKYTDTAYQSFYVDLYDYDQNENYEAYRDHIDKVLDMTDFPQTPWHILDGSKIKDASREALGLALEALQKGIERVSTRREDGVRHHRDYKEKDYILQNIDMSPVLDRDSYKEKLEDLQVKSNDVMLRLRKAGIPVILAFEGVDAAGKDGAIKRLIKEMDPRAYTIHPISAPDETEHKHHYLWRFYKRFHRKAHLDIFSRSWYGRVMVERIEGFATENEWERAYDEMLRMEKDMADEGAMILKFFVTIDKDTQLDRFQARENDEDKQFKITEEDWRNRGRWDDYIEAMNEMLVRTDAPYAPWIVVPGNDKYYARIFVMEAFIKQAEKILAKEKAD